MLDKLIDVLLSFLHLFQFWTTCDAEYQGFVRRFGLPVRDLRPGWNWLWPFIERSTQVDVRLWADVLPPQSLRTRDGTDVVLRLMVSHSVSDPRTFSLQVFDARNNVEDVAAGQLGSAVSAATIAELDSGVVLRKVRRKVITAAKAWGLTVYNVQFVDLCRAPSVRIFGVKDDPS